MKRIAVLAALLLVAAGCGDSGDGNNAVEPIESILDAPLEMVADPDGTTATLRATTTIPVACAVVYGTDGSFGSIAVDNDMQGGAHSDHQPLLTGLAPDTEYQYRLQGSDADGNIYRSETLTFRTPAAVDLGLGENVATGGEVLDVSSEFSEAFAASNAIDGDAGTEWSSAGDGDGAWIEIDLGQPTRISAVWLRTREMGDGTAVTDTFTVAVDGDEVGTFPAGAGPAVLDPTVTGRIVRIDAADTTGGNTGAVEIEILSPG